MRTIPFETVVDAVETIVMEINYNLPGDVLEAIKRSRESESSPLAVSVLDNIIENAGIARDEQLPICQDTGIAVFFADIGGEGRLLVQLFHVRIVPGTGTRQPLSITAFA